MSLWVARRLIGERLLRVMRVTRGKVEENCESQWMKKFWESLGCVLIVCLFLCRPYDLLQHPKELARQITLIDHGKYKTLISHDGLVVF